jgi:hypothetical protein
MCDVESPPGRTLQDDRQWYPDDLARIDLAHELEIAVKRADGTLR